MSEAISIPISLLTKSQLVLVARANNQKVKTGLISNPVKHKKGDLLNEITKQKIFVNTQEILELDEKRKLEKAKRLFIQKNGIRALENLVVIPPVAGSSCRKYPKDEKPLSDRLDRKKNKK